VRNIGNVGHKGRDEVIRVRSGVIRDSDGRRFDRDMKEETNKVKISR
jgi:hypothetical protein